MKSSVMLRVPLVDLEAQHRPIRDELLAAVARVLDSQRFILGPEVEALERELAALLEVEHAIGVSSGTDALLAALMAAGVDRGHEVVTSPYSFFATAGSIARLGARPVFVDIDPETYNVDTDAAVSAIGPRTKALLPVHLFGLSAHLDPMLAAAARGGVVIIEDACQAIGARYQGRPVGGLGAFGTFSFFPTKNLGTLGDGGLVTTSGAALAERVRTLRAHGAREKYVHAVIGGNFRLDALHAAILRVKAKHLARWTAARRANAARYRRLIEEARLSERGIALPVEPPGYVHVFNQFVIRARRRDELRAHLAARGIGTQVYYPVPLHRQACFVALGYKEGACPHAETAARETLALPVYPELSEAQQAHVVRCIAEFYE